MLGLSNVCVNIESNKTYHKLGHSLIGIKCKNLFELRVLHSVF